MPWWLSDGVYWGRFTVGWAYASSGALIHHVIPDRYRSLVAFSAGSGKIRCVRKTFSKQNPWWMWLAGVFGAIAVFYKAGGNDG